MLAPWLVLRPDVGVGVAPRDVSSPARLAAQCRCVSASNEYEGTSRDRRNGIRVPRLNFAEVNLNLRKGKSMSEITRVGVDLAKRLIQVHGVDATGRAVTTKAISRGKFLAWCAQLPLGCV